MIWNVAPEGSEKLLYRLYKKDRDLLKLKNTGGKETKEVLSSQVFDAKETVLKMKSEDYKINSETFSTDQNLFKQQPHLKKNDFENISSDLHSSQLSDDVKLSNRLKVSKINTTKEISSYKNNKSDVYSREISDKMEVSLDKEISHDKVIGVGSNDRFQVFRQWFRFTDQSKPVFDPQVEVWEVSSDNGVHWMQILNINAEKYVTNAKCFDPDFYLEYHVIKKRNSPYSKLTLLSEFVKQVERGPAIFPKSGIIPAKASVANRAQC